MKLATLIAVSLMASQTPRAEAAWLKDAIGLFAQTQPAEAGCCNIRKAFRKLDKARRKATQAAIDVVTVGEAPRQRDKKEAEKREAVAREQRIAAERAKTQAINALKEKIDTYQSVLRDFDFFVNYAKLNSAELALISDASQRTLSDRTWWDKSGLPRWTEKMKEEQAYAALVLEQLEILAETKQRIRANSRDSEQPISQEEEKQKYEENSKALSDMQIAIVRLKELARNAQMDTTNLVSESLRRTGIQDAERMVRKLVELGNALGELEVYTNVRREYYAKEMKSVQDQLEALISPPPAPEKKPAPAPAPEKKKAPPRIRIERPMPRWAY